MLAGISKFPRDGSLAHFCQLGLGMKLGQSNVEGGQQ